MPLVQRIDEMKNPYKHTLYSGSGYNRNSKLPKAYIQTGGAFDLSALVDAGLNFVKDNKDLIQTGVSTAGKVVDLGKSISDTIEKSKELEVEKIKELRAKKAQQSKKPKKTFQFSDEQEAKMKALRPSGAGFVNVKK